MKSANANEAFIGTFSSSSSRRKVVVEDDGKVCYAYLLDDVGNICGDVWLYNRCLTTIEPEWNQRENLPFANPASHSCQSSDFCPPRSAEEISVEWIQTGEFEVARIYLSSTYFAKLVHGAKPGWSLFASKDGPLARALKEER